jgi:hypothetical protein
VLKIDRLLSARCQRAVFPIAKQSNVSQGNMRHGLHANHKLHRNLIFDFDARGRISESLNDGGEFRS